jgi:hypothetical protein
MIIKLVFHCDETNCFSEFIPYAQIWVTIVGNDSLGYTVSAEITDTRSGGSDGWYSFLESYACNRQLFDSLGYPTPNGMSFDTHEYSWRFRSLELATLWCKIWASIGCGAKYSHSEISS